MIWDLNWEPSEKIDSTASNSTGVRSHDYNVIRRSHTEHRTVNIGTSAVQSFQPKP